MNIYKSQNLFIRENFKLSNPSKRKKMSQTYQAIDFGCNFGSIKRYPLDKITRILADAQQANIGKCVVISNSLSETRHAVSALLPLPTNSSEDSTAPTAADAEAVAQRRQMLTFTVGIHPHNANRFRASRDLAYIRQTYESHPQCIAIGEIGLDYNRMFSSREEQLAAFEGQLLLAKELHAPLYLHVRDAFEDFQNLLEKHQYFHGIVHCFTGNREEASYFIERGFYIGITGVLMDKRRNGTVVEVIRDIAPLERLIVETDAPFMSYFGRNKRESVPQDVFYLIQEIARLKGISEEECGQQLLMNANALMAKGVPSTL
jgi:TatD DNase family protein